MARTPRIIILLLVFAGLLALSTPVSGATLGNVVVDEQVSVGESMIITISGRGNITLQVNAPAGTVLRTARIFGNGSSESWVLPVTREWEFGRGLVFVTFQDGNLTETENTEFEIICNSRCLAGLIEDAVADSMRPIWYILGLVLLMALMYVGHAAVQYHDRHGEASWKDYIVALVHPMRRSAMRIEMMDHTGLLPEKQMAQLKRLQNGVLQLREGQKQWKVLIQERRFLVARAKMERRKFRKLKARADKIRKLTDPVVRDRGQNGG